MVMHDENMNAPTPGDDESVIIDWDAHRPQSTPVLQGIRNLVGEQAEIAYAPGCDILKMDRSGFPEAVALAQDAEVAIVVVGDRSGLGGDSTTGEAIDRATLELPGVQQELVLAVAATGIPTIVVCLCGRPPMLTDIVDSVSAILIGWVPAQEGGAAIANILFGDATPGGKLPISLPRHVGQVPVYYGHKPSGGRSHWHGDYMDMSTKPLFAFGYGLSYTTFGYHELSVTPSQARANEIVTIQFELSNLGTVGGEEVIQLYVGDPVASVTRPVKQLKAFKRVWLDPGQVKQVNITLDVAHLAFYDRDMRYGVEPGKIQVMIGTASDNICLEGQFEIIGAAQTVDQVFTSVVTLTELR
jgi:beta-glucosidase